MPLFIYDKKGSERLGIKGMEYEEFRNFCKRIERAVSDPYERNIVRKELRTALHKYSFDPLTGLRKFSYLKSLYKRVKNRIEKGKDISILLIDIDNFKHVNDNCSYKEADRLLKRAGDILNELLERTVEIVSGQIRSEPRRENGKGLIKDIAARYHEVKGDELIIALYGTGREGAEKVTERILGYVREDPLFKEHKSSLSIGVASKNGCSDIETIIKHAEHNLKKAKMNGKNCYVSSENVLV